MPSAMPARNNSGVLIADVPEMEEVLRSCFSSRAVTYVYYFDTAVRALRVGAFGMVVIGLQFDESRMFQLVQFVRCLPRYDNTPVVCIRGMPSILSAAAREGIRQAVLASGGDAFVDFGLAPRDVDELRQRLADVVRGQATPAAAFDELHSSLRH
jgi:hypothetical protein